MATARCPRDPSCRCGAFTRAVTRWSASLLWVIMRGRFRAAGHQFYQPRAKHVERHEGHALGNGARQPGEEFLHRAGLSHRHCLGCAGRSARPRPTRRGSRCSIRSAAISNVNDVTDGNAMIENWPRPRLACRLHRGQCDDLRRGGDIVPGLRDDVAKLSFPGAGGLGSPAARPFSST